MRLNGAVGIPTSLRKRADRFADRHIRHGARKVLWTQPTANLGNFLYDWMHAFTWQARGEDIVCLVTPKVGPWLPLFGEAAERLVVRRSDVRLTDRREKDVYSDYGRSFSQSELDAFIEGFLEPSAAFSPDLIPRTRRLGPSDVLINVRRGDYVAVEAHRVKYAFALDEYLMAALSTVRNDGHIDRIQVVSDGIDWCAANLGWLNDHCRHVQFVTEPLRPAVHMAMLSRAPRLILANSTFSYWGGYLNTWAHDAPSRVIAPWFHARPEGAAWQVDPSWTLIKDIPSEWRLPESSTSPG